MWVIGSSCVGRLGKTGPTNGGACRTGCWINRMSCLNLQRGSHHGVRPAGAAVFLDEVLPGSIATGAWGITGMYFLRNLQLHSVTRPEPSTHTIYWSNWQTSITMPVLPHLVGLGPTWVWILTMHWKGCAMHWKGCAGCVWGVRVHQVGMMQFDYRPNNGHVTPWWQGSYQTRRMSLLCGHTFAIHLVGLSAGIGGPYPIGRLAIKMMISGQDSLSWKQ